MTSRIDPADIPLSPNFAFESALLTAGVFPCAGLDEAGRGAWAGPVAAAAVILPCEPSIEKVLHGVRDSKQMTPRQRSDLAPLIKNVALAWAVGFASREEIDQKGILAATRTAMQRALQELHHSPAHLIIDALFLPEVDTPQTALLKGDQRSLSVAAASVLAKTARDEWMTALDEQFPGYGFAAHKGYGTSLHQQALARLGPCQEHRTSFAPIQIINLERELSK